MADKSPGVYFNEYDNTAFTNPKTVTGTTVGIVGYAKKGEIGVPTLVTSWVDFKAKFGTPIKGLYSGLAAYNVLSAGGAVMFCRVADDTACQSNYVVKNPIEGKNGSVSFTKTTDIKTGISGYYNGLVYTFKATTYDGDSKVFFVRSPASGKLTQASILAQIGNQLGTTAASHELKLNNTIPSGLFSFNIEKNNEAIADETFYIATTTAQAGRTLAESIANAITTGTNGYTKMVITRANDGGLGETPIDPEVALHITGVKRFTINKGTSESLEVQIDTVDSDTLKTIVNKLDAKLSSAYSIRAILSEQNMASEGETPKNYPCIVFIRSDKGEGNSLNIGSIKTTEDLVEEDFDDGSTTVKRVVNCNDLFLASANGNATSFMATCEQAAEYSLQCYEYEAVQNSGSLYKGLTVEYVEETNSVILKSEATGSSEAIKFIAGKYGEPLIENVSTSDAVLTGTDEIALNVYRNENSNYKIKFESINSITAPSIENISASDIGAETLPGFFRNLSTIMVDLNDAESTGFDEPEQGADAVAATARDMIVFTSKEKGTATNNIKVEVYSTTSPIDGSVTRYLNVYVDGTLKEKFENISLAYDDIDNRFDTVINESTDNGGSAYMTVKVIKNDYANPEVELSDGVYYIGKANKSTDVAKDDDIEVSGYAYYDYMVGNDGVAEDGGDLFEEAMKAGTSPMANKELYDFHILIAPDDITQQVQTAMINLCEDRGDAIAIIDPPIGLDKQAVIDWHNGKGGYGRSVAPQSNYAATYWPWCKVSDPTNNNKICWVMPSLVIAPLYVGVDKSVGCWYAPAGEQNGQLSVIDIEKYPNRLDRDDLYVDYNRINPITKFKDGNIYVYGEKTLHRTNSVLTKVHTRRMLVQIKKQCREALRGYIFQPNTSSVLGKISGNVSAILEAYRAGGGLASYQVICDETNNPTEVRQQDIVNVDVILIPNGTIEQINISLTLNKKEETVTTE